MKMKYSLIIICLSLVGCNGEEKRTVQSELDNTKGKALCYNLGMDSVSYPIDIIDLPKPHTLKYDFNKTYKALHVFSEIGFLTEEKLAINSSESNNTVLAFRYNLTDEGKQHSYGSNFCFGRVVVNEITKSSDIEYLQLSMRVDTGKQINYTYHFDDIPEWAKSPKLAKVYDIKNKLNGQLFSAQAITSKKNHNISTKINITISIRD